MSEAGWADETVAAAQRRYPNANTLNIAAYVAAKEHKRAVRVVKREIERVRKDLHSYRGHEKTVALAVLENILAALQKGRT